MTENWNFQLFFAFSSKILELDMGYCCLRLYTAETRPGGEHLLRISGIFHIYLTSFQANETGKNYLRIVFFLILLPFLMSKMK